MPDVPSPASGPPLRVVVAMDSFKGSVTSAEANAAVREGVLAASPDAEVSLIAVADGGEGTVAALAPHGRASSVAAVDLLGNPVEAPYVVLDGAVAVESASTLGLPLLGEPSPMLARRAHSYGLGLQVRRVAVATGAPRLLVGLGGTGTTDGGLGFLLALGARIRTAGGDELSGAAPPPGANPLLSRPVAVELPRPHVELIGLTDVAAPLLGPRGAARQFGPQKGADPALVDELEEAMVGWAQTLADAGAEVADTPGSGAAGGLGAAVLALGGRLEPGLDRVLRETRATAALARADLVLTGEGRIDRQTAEGKAPAALARLARRRSTTTADEAASRPRVVALAGAVDADDDLLSAIGLDGARSIHAPGLPLAEAMDRERTLAALASRAARETRALRG